MLNKYKGPEILTGIGLKKQHWKQCFQKFQNYFQSRILYLS